MIPNAVEIVKKAEEASVTIRVMGAAAVAIHCTQNAHLLDKMGRKLSDLDFVALSSKFKEVRQVFEKAGYTAARVGYGVSIAEHGKRMILDSPGKAFRADVFFDRLEMCHTIDFTKRLNADCPTIPLAELLLEKTQIVKMNEKDIIDVIVLLTEHDVGHGDRETVNSDHISSILSKDWGFCYTVTTNLRNLKERVARYPALSDEAGEPVRSRIDSLVTRIQEEPKSLAWKARARIGPTKKWYNDVEEVVR